MSFPYHVVPDGSVLLPHHFTWAAIFALLPAAVVWDDYRHREPVAYVAGLVGSLVSFLLVWPAYPTVGATLALAGTAVATAALCWPDPDARLRWWAHWEPRYWLLAALLVAVAWDDLLQHAFGVVTPLDWAWKHGLRDLITTT